MVIFLFHILQKRTVVQDNQRLNIKVLYNYKILGSKQDSRLYTYTQTRSVD